MATAATQPKYFNFDMDLATRGRENIHSQPEGSNVALSSRNTYVDPSSPCLSSPVQSVFPSSLKPVENQPSGDPNMAFCDPIYSQQMQPCVVQSPYGTIYQPTGVPGGNYDMVWSDPSMVLSPQNVAPKSGGVLPFRCPEYGCGIFFDQRGDFKRHIRKHTAQRPFICDTCGEGFKTSNVLDVHKRVHSNKFMFQCEYPQCTKQFKHKYTLSVHRRTHTGERPFPCKKCSRTFADRTALTVHARRKHSHVRPYACTHCPKSFCESSSLRRHMATHTQSRPYWCSICQKGLATRSGFAQHTKTQKHLKKCETHTGDDFDHSNSPLPSMDPVEFMNNNPEYNSARQDNTIPELHLDQAESPDAVMMYSTSMLPEDDDDFMKVSGTLNDAQPFGALSPRSQRREAEDFGSEFTFDLGESSMDTSEDSDHPFPVTVRDINESIVAVKDITPTGEKWSSKLATLEELMDNVPELPKPVLKIDTTLPCCDSVVINGKSVWSPILHGRCG
eukprot:213750_1